MTICVFRFLTRSPVLPLVVLFLGSTIRSGESFATPPHRNTLGQLLPTAGSGVLSTATTALSAASFAELRSAFPENPNIVGAGGWNNLETLSADPKAALVKFVVDGLQGAASAVQPKANSSSSSSNNNNMNEKLEALSLLLYGMGKGFVADAIDGEWDLVFTKQGSKSPSFQKLVGTTETAGSSKNIFDIRSMIFHGDVRFWKWGRVSSSVEYNPTSDSFSKAPDGTIVVRKIVCKIVNAFFKWWKLPGIPFPLPKNTGFLEIVYLDEDIRVTKGNRGGFFVHFRPAYLQQVLAA